MNHANAACATHFGSQCAIVKLKLMRVTNMSASNRISWTDGGGNAIANATIPSSVGWDFRVCGYVYCGRKRQSNNTTWKHSFDAIEIDRISSKSTKKIIDANAYEVKNELRLNSV